MFIRFLSAYSRKLQFTYFYVDGIIIFFILRLNNFKIFNSLFKKNCVSFIELILKILIRKIHRY
jgi:hypothetical protein